MSDILEPKEIDALLAAVDQGRIDASPASGAKREPTAEPYDFKRPEHVGKDRLRAIAALHETFARSAGSNLSTLLRRLVEVQLSSVEQTTFSEFLHSAAKGACVAILSAKPLEGKCLLAIDPGIVFPMLDRLVGGAGEDPVVPDRPLTGIENRLVVKIATGLAPLLKEAWSHVKAIDFTVTEVPSNPQILEAAPPHDPVVVVRFEMSMGRASGRASLCVPYATIEPIMDLFTAERRPAGSRKPAPDPSSTRIARSLAEAEVEVAADLTTTQITVRELLELSPGDLIRTDAAVDSEATIRVEGKPKFKGQPGRNRRNKAVLITRPIEPGKTK